MIRALIPLAHGVEEMEAVIAIDTFRRAGWEVVSAGIYPGLIIASRGVRLMPDAAWDEIDPTSFDVLVVPGGSEGTAALCRDERVLEAIRHFMQSGKPVGAICAGPLVLQSAGVLAGRKVTCHPRVAPQLTRGTRLDHRVVVDGRLITSQAAGTTFEFALAIIESVDAEKAREVAASMLARK